MRSLRTSVINRPSGRGSSGASAARASRWKTWPSTEDAPLAGVELVEPGREQRLDRRRHRDVAAVLGPHRHHLLDEEWVAAGRFEDPLAELAGNRVGERLDQLIRLLGRQRLEQDVGRVQHAAAPRRPGVEQLRPRHAEEQDRRVAAEVGDVLDQVQEGRLAPMHVLEDDDDRPLSRARLQQLAEGPGDLLGRAGRGLVAENRGERGRRAVLGLGQQLLHDLGYGPVADPLAIGEAAAASHGRALQRAEKLLDQARLADARRAQDREQVAGALARDAGEGILEQPAVPHAAHHRRAVPPRHRGNLALDGEQPERRHRLGLTLGLDRRGGLDLDRVANEPVRLLAEEHLSRLRRLLEPGRDVDRVSGRQPLLGAGHHLAGVDAHPQLEPRAVGAFELLVQLCEAVAELRRGAHRAQRVVLVHGRDAEDGHHRVADELLDGAAVPLDDRLRRLEVAGP